MRYRRQCRMSTAPLLVLCSFIALILAARAPRRKSCGSHSIPSGFVFDAKGGPELLCDTPACFGPPQQFPMYEYDVLDELGRHRRHSQPQYSHRYANCSGRFTSRSCSANNEWTAGIEERSNGTHSVLFMECCQFDRLNHATISRIVQVKPGQPLKVGGLMENGKLVAFDLVKEVQRNITENNEINYLVLIFRLSCIPDPTETRNAVSAELESVMGDTETEFPSERVRRKPAPRRNTALQSTMNSNYQFDYAPSRLHSPRRSDYVQPSFRPAFYPRRRQFFRPVFDEYEYYDNMEPLPVVKRPIFTPYRQRFGHARGYGPQARRRMYSVPTEPLMEFSEPGTAYSPADLESPGTLPSSFFETSNPSSVAPLPESSMPLPPDPPPPPSQILNQPLPPPQTSYRSSDYRQSSVVQLPSVPPASVYPIAPTYAVAPVAPSYATYPTAVQQPASCNPCGGSSANSYAQPGYDPNSYYSGTARGGYGTDLNSVFSSLQCFSKDTLVQTPGGPKRMDELEIGDLVLSVDQSLISYSPVIMFLHQKHDEIGIFKKIITSDGRQIKLTENHLIYVTDCLATDTLRLVAAKEVHVGQCVYGVNDRNPDGLRAAKVISVIDVREKGIYAPLTATGDIFVNSIIASCHSNVAVQTLQQTFFSWYRKISDTFLMVRKSFGIYQTVDSGELPLGVEYVTSVMDILLPQSLFS